MKGTRTGSTPLSNKQTKQNKIKKKGKLCQKPRTQNRTFLRQNAKTFVVRITGWRKDTLKVKRKLKGLESSHLDTEVRGCSRLKPRAGRTGNF